MQGIIMANVEADKAPNKAMNNSILGTQIANKNDKNTKNERNKLWAMFEFLNFLKRVPWIASQIVLLATENCKL